MFKKLWLLISTMVHNNRKIIICLGMLISIFSMNFACSEIFEDCSVYGNCKPLTTTTSATNYSLVNVNNSQNLGGIPGSGYIRTDGSSTTTAQIPFAYGIDSQADANFQGDIYNHQKVRIEWDHQPESLPYAVNDVFHKITLFKTSLIFLQDGERE